MAARIPDNIREITKSLESLPNIQTWEKMRGGYAVVRRTLFRYRISDQAREQMSALIKAINPSLGRVDHAPIENIDFHALITHIFYDQDRKHFKLAESQIDYPNNRSYRFQGIVTPEYTLILRSRYQFDFNNKRYTSSKLNYVIAFWPTMSIPGLMRNVYPELTTEDLDEIVVSPVAYLKYQRYRHINAEHDLPAHFNAGLLPLYRMFNKLSIKKIIAAIKESDDPKFVINHHLGHVTFSFKKSGKYVCVTNIHISDEILKNNIDVFNMRSKYLKEWQFIHTYLGPVLPYNHNRLLKYIHDKV